MTADVVLPVPVDRTFAYSVPEEFQGVVRAGVRVLVPFGRRRLTGVVVGTGDRPGELKEIDDCLDREPVFTAELLDLTRWVGSYYMCSWGLVLKAALPAGMSYESKKTVSLGPHPKGASQDGRDRALITFVAKNGPISLVKIERKLSWRPSLSRLTRLVDADALRVHDKMAIPRVKARTARYLRSIPREAVGSTELRGARQMAVLESVRAFEESGHLEPSMQDVLRSTGATTATVNSLVKRGLLEIFEKEFMRTPIGDVLLDTGPPPKHTLHPAQENALEHILGAIERKQYASFLLHGVTGSGKTEVYIKALSPVIERGQTGIVLVPEISLTPQTVTRFRSHFGDRVAVWHSRMSLGERFDTWRSLHAGKYSIVVGARSAIFAPLQNIGLIVVDEEHEASYKQYDPAPRYQARDVAVYRARLNNAVCVLGSATPSMESVHNARRGKYTLLEMHDRVPLASGETAQLPEIHIVNLTLQKRRQQLKGSLSNTLVEAITDRLHKKQQIILLQNRRGFSPVVQCQDCGWSPECRDCAVNLTYHKSHRHLRCHYCGFSRPLPEKCDLCTSRELERHGVGTQRIEEELGSLFPEARVLRMDLDTTGNKGAVHGILSKFGAGQADILLGTQMVAKGLDFSRVTLVGVVNADTGLLLPDFRASERTFQLLSQVAGRAGRGDLAGDVFLQTRNPKSDVIVRATNHDFAGFSEGELADRQALGYPPFGRVIFLQFRGEEEDAVARVAEAATEEVRDVLDPDVSVLGPEPAFIARVKKLYRYQTVLKIPPPVRHETVRETLARAIAAFGARKSGVRVIVDVDPAGF